ncbi:CU044_5270 family protein [Zhihengliuella halotolerans]|uniref:CU044_5270 family protein n=1 Tax=Zhihengliuella halotolerans TaxID=370736 RepID=UPI000C8064E8|nr:CU044_5270 family protein [Zhihengliuella halotolerans]
MKTQQNMNPQRRDAMRAMIVAEVDAASPQPKKTSHTLVHDFAAAVRRRKVVAGVAVAAVAAAAFVAVDLVRPADWHGTAPAAAAEVLHAAAANTIRTADPVLRPGQYLKIQTEDTHAVDTGDENGEFAFAQFTETTTTYVPANTDGEWVRTGSSSLTNAFDMIDQDYFDQFVGDAAAQTHPIVRGTAADFHAGAKSDDDFGPWGADPVAYMAELPRDPERLLEDMKARTDYQGSAPDQHRLFSLAADVLNSRLPDADLRAAIYQALALMPWVEFVDEPAESDGHIGAIIRIVREDGVVGEDLIIDRDSGMLIGTRSVYLEDADRLEAGTVVGTTTSTIEVVDRAP